MLWDEAVAQHLDSLPSHFLNDRWIVEKPPATERQQVPEFPSVHAEFMLIFAAENADEESVIGELEAKMLHCAKIRLPYPVSSEFDSWIDLVANTDHDRKRDVPLSPGRQNGFCQQATADAVLRKHKGIR